MSPLHSFFSRTRSKLSRLLSRHPRTWKPMRRQRLYLEMLEDRVVLTSIVNTHPHVDYQVVNSWGTGLQATMTIVNDQSSTINDWTLDYGPRGREAVRRLLEEAHRAGIIPKPVAVEFV